MVARLERRLAQLAQAPHRMRRHADGIKQHRLRLVQCADRFVGARQPVIGIDEVFIRVDQVFQDVPGFLVAFAQEQGLGQSQPGPGDRLGLDQPAVERLGLLRLAQEHVQLGAQAHEVDQVARVLRFARQAGVDRFALAARLHQAVHRHEHIAFIQGARDTLQQAVGGKGFQDVVGGPEFGGADDLAVVALGGDHEEHGRQRHQLVVADVFQQLLAVLAAFERVFAQDQVVGLGAEVLDRLVGTARMVDLAQAAQGEHVVDGRTHSGMRLDDQRAEAVKFIHGSGRFRICLRRAWRAAWARFWTSILRPGIKLLEPARG